MINNDFSNKFKAFGAFNATNAIQTCNVKMAKELIFLGEPHDVMINNVENPITLGLFYVGWSPNAKQVEETLNIGVLENINEQDSRGKTALIYAIIKDHVEVVKVLLENKADVNTQEKDEYTALIYAMEKGHVEVVKLLLANNADVNLQNKFGNTALMQANHKGHVEVVKALLENKADINLQECPYLPCSP